ncbi:MAG: hypothetical protein WB565_16625 [Acidimicrobiales bacterium]
MKTVIKLALSVCAAAFGVVAIPALVTSVSATPTAVNVPCSAGAAGLVAAIGSANTAGGGTINLAPGCTYVLTAPNNVSSIPMLGGSNGLPVISTSIAVNGFNTTITRNSAKPFRFFEVDSPDGNLTARGLTLTNGLDPAGGALLNAQGIASLTNCEVNGNTAQMGGGGIASGVVNPADVGPIGRLTLNATQVDNNTVQAAGGGGGGGGILNHAGTLTLNGSEVDGNLSQGGGGGIASGPGNGGSGGNSVLTLNFSRVNGNTSNGGPADGAGGIANGGSATLNASLVDDNSAPGAPGGGILNHGVMTLSFVQVSKNSAATDANGDQGDGGGIANINLAGVGATSPSGVLTLNLSTVNGNNASGVGGGIADVGVDAEGGLTAPAGPLTLKLSVVTGNTAGVDGGGIYTVPGAGSPVSLFLSLVFRNAPDNCSPVGMIRGCFG